MTSSERDRARIAAAAEASAYENEGDAERSPAHERGYIAGATAEVARHAPVRSERERANLAEARVVKLEAALRRINGLTGLDDEDTAANAGIMRELARAALTDVPPGGAGEERPA